MNVLKKYRYQLIEDLNLRKFRLDQALDNVLTLPSDEAMGALMETRQLYISVATTENHLRMVDSLLEDHNPENKLESAIDEIERVLMDNKDTSVNILYLENAQRLIGEYIKEELSK